MMSFGGRDPELGCGFLSAREVDALVEGRLSERRLGRFERHGRDGCEACLVLDASVGRFREVLEHGVLETERAAFEKTRLVVRARLRQEVERLEAGGGWRARFPFNVGRDLSADELEQIAAAGRRPETDPDDEDDDDEQA